MSEVTRILEAIQHGDGSAADELLPLPNVEAARLLEIPERTAKRTWAYARAWLYEELKNSR